MRSGLGRLSRVAATCHCKEPNADQDGGVNAGEPARIAQARSGAEMQAAGVANVARLPAEDGEDGGRKGDGNGDGDDQLGGGDAACARNGPNAEPARLSRGLPLDASTRVSFAQALEEYAVTHARSRQSTRWCQEGRRCKLLHVMM